MRELSRYNFKEELRLSEKSAVVFYAPWCTFCKSMEAVCEAVEKLCPQVKFFRVDIDENSELAESYGVKSVPTLIAFEGADERARKTGLMSKRKLVGLLGE